MAHYSIGDGLREWMRANQDAPLAATIQDKLDNQGFLTSGELNPFIRTAVQAAVDERKQGVLLDGYPRNLEQLHSLHEPWLFGEELLRRRAGKKAPDMVLTVHVSEDSARERYVSRARDQRDTLEKFQRRFREYEAETLPVEEVYRERGVLVEVDANGTKEENWRALERRLHAREVGKASEIGGIVGQ